MNKSELEKYKIDQGVRLTIFGVGLLAAVLLALFKSSYAGEAFALVSGLVGGSALSGK